MMESTKCKVLMAVLALLVTSALSRSISPSECQLTDCTRPLRDGKSSYLDQCLYVGPLTALNLNIPSTETTFTLTWYPTFDSCTSANHTAAVYTVVDGADSYVHVPILPAVNHHPVAVYISAGSKESSGAPLLSMNHASVNSLSSRSTHAQPRAASATSNQSFRRRYPRRIGPGAIAGIVIGLLLIICIGIGLYLYFSRRRKPQFPQQYQVTPQPAQNWPQGYAGMSGGVPPVHDRPLVEAPASAPAPAHTAPISDLESHREETSDLYGVSSDGRRTVSDRHETRSEVPSSLDQRPDASLKRPFNPDIHELPVQPYK